MKKIGFIIILLTGFIIKSPGQEAASEMVFSLKDAIDYAVNYNKSLANARLEVEKSKHNFWEAVSQGLPKVDGSLDYMTYFNYELRFEFGMPSDFEFSSEQIAQARDLTLAAFPGVTEQDLYRHTAGNFFDNTLSAMLPPSTILMSDQSTARLQLSQLIFSGQYIVGIQTAKLAKKISEQNVEFSELDVKEAVINAYYLVLITVESLNILEQNLNNLKDILEHTRKMYSTGMAEKTDVDQLRITVNQLENARNSVRRNLELTNNMLRFQLGLEMDVNLILSDNLPGLFYDLSPEDALIDPFNIESNVTYQIMKTQEAISKKLVELEQWNYAPTIAGFYTYNEKIMTTGFDMNPNHLAGLSLSMPIFSSGMRKARVDQAKISYQVAQTNRSILEDQLHLQDKQFRYNLQNALENYETQKENVEVAKSVYNSYRLKFEQGMASSLDLTQANSNYLDAEGNYIGAIMEVLNAKLQLDKLKNNIE